MNREFLKEAIADAKAVKETAIANAKAALEESFTPHLKTMLSAKLEEMEKEDDEVDEAKNSGKIKEKKEYMTKKEKREGDDRRSDDKTEVETEKMRKIKEDDDSDLDEVLAELEDDLNEDTRTDAEEEGYKDGIEDAKDDMEKEIKDIELEEDERTDAEEEGYLEGEEDEEIDLEDMTDEDLKKFIEDVISDMVAAGEIEAGEEFGVEDEVEVDDEVEVEDEVEVTIDEDERTDAEEEGYKDGIKDARADAKKKVDDIKLEEKDEELKEAYATVKTLRNELNEINLLNAKLLYTNKIFKAKNLNESKKVKVLTSFDKAETVKEAKLIYDTLKDGLTNKRVKRSLNESIGMASRSAGIGPKKVNAKPIIESNEMVSRFKKLAGII